MKTLQAYHTIQRTGPFVVSQQYVHCTTCVRGMLDNGLSKDFKFTRYTGWDAFV